MSVIVTRKPGGITQLFNTESGRVTYKCKADSAYMLIEAFGGIVKFNQKGATATVSGHVTSEESCEVIKKGHPEYAGALRGIISSYKEHARLDAGRYEGEIRDLEGRLSAL